MGSEGNIEEGEHPRGDGSPHGVRETIRRRLSRLSGECRHVLSVGSVFGSEFDSEVVGRTAHEAEGRVRQAFSEAIAAGIIQPVPGSSGQHRFAHSLIRRVLYEGLPPDRRARLHAAAAEAVEALHAGELGSHVAEIANHLSLAGPYGEPAKATDYARCAGDQALAALAFEEAARQYRTALDANGRVHPQDQELRRELLHAARVAERRARAPARPSRS